MMPSTPAAIVKMNSKRMSKLDKLKATRQKQITKRKLAEDKYNKKLELASNKYVQKIIKKLLKQYTQGKDLCKYEGSPFINMAVENLALIKLKRLGLELDNYQSAISCNAYQLNDWLQNISHEDLEKYNIKI